MNRKAERLALIVLSIIAFCLWFYIIIVTN